MEGESKVIVYRLGANCDTGEVEEGKIYSGKVQGFANFGAADGSAVASLPWTINGWSLTGSPAARFESYQQMRQE